jgi:hypothetical protein
MQGLQVGVFRKAGETRRTQAVIDGLLKQRKGFVAVALARVEASEIVGRGGGIGMVGAEDAAANFLGLPLERFGFRVTVL